MPVMCYFEDCIHCEKDMCKCAGITAFDENCKEYKLYSSTEEYQSEYWICVEAIDGVIKTKGKYKKRGKEITIRDRKFFTSSDTRYSDFDVYVTDARTGYYCGDVPTLIYRWGTYLRRTAKLEDVETLPSCEYDAKNRKYVIVREKTSGQYAKNTNVSSELPSRAVLISIRPKWCELIANGKKTIEVRKTKPKLKTPFKCYIYCTTNDLLTKSHDNGKIYVASKKRYQAALERNGNVTLSGKVIGEFVCDEIIYPISVCYSDVSKAMHKETLYFTGLTDKEIIDYLGNGGNGYGWHISDLKIYDKPKELSEFKKYNRDANYSPCSHLGLAIPDCRTCKECNLKRPPQSWCYVERTFND